MSNLPHDERTAAVRAGRLVTAAIGAAYRGGPSMSALVDDLLRIRLQLAKRAGQAFEAR